MKYSVDNLFNLDRVGIRISASLQLYINFSNVDISGDEITTFKSTNNYVRNSEMLFRGINELYNYDATKSELEGVSFMNAITACDNFNL